MENHLTDLDYCKGEKFLKNVIESLSIAFDINEEGVNEIRKAYQEFTNEFYDASTSNGLPKTIDRNFFKPRTDESPFTDAFLNKVNTVGIDLPVYIKSAKKSNEKCVIIIGEDPLREGDYAVYNEKEDIVLSTPFGTHFEAYRKKMGKSYWTFSNNLINKGYSIYYTDIKKVWVKKNNSAKSKKIKSPIPRDLHNKFEECLRKEIELFSINAEILIVTFGNDAKSSIKEFIKDDTMVLSFIHPTFTASRHWKKNIFNNKIEGRLTDSISNYMIEEFQRKFESNLPITQF